MGHSDEEKKEIVYVYRYWQRFNQTVYDILQEKYTVKPIRFYGIGSIWKIFRNIKKDNISIVHFAGKQALVTTFLGKLKHHKTIIIVAGYDVAKSHHNSKIMWAITKVISKLSILYADYVIDGSSKYLEKEMFSFVQPRKYFYCPAPSAVDTHFFKCNSPFYKEKIVISVGIISKKSFERKRFDIFSECATRLPKINFVWAGLSRDTGFIDNLNFPSNLKLMKDLSDTELRNLMARATVYCQLSRDEGFGLAMAEAMACECVPVVTPVGAIPEVVGDAGIYVPYGDVEKTVEGIKEALSKPELGKKARQRIVENYSKEKLKPEFLKIIDEIYSELENLP
ncbi:MAG: glycosyltransferase [Thermoplasmata archaeon]